MNLKFKTGLIASLGAAAFTPLLACACSQSNTKTVTERTLKLVYIDGYYEDVETYMVNNDKTICYITLPELLRIYYESAETKITSYSNGVYVYQFNDSLCKIDTVNDKISFTDPNTFFDGNVFIPYGSEPINNFQVIEETSKVTHLGQKDKEGYYKAFDLAKYNFDILDLNGNDAIIPLEPLSTIFATTNLFAGICYDRNKLIFASSFTWSILMNRELPPTNPEFLNYNYNCLCFTFDYNYGLKSRRYIKDYDTFFRNEIFKIDDKYLTYYDALHSASGVAYASRALVSIIEGECDDGHTSYSIPPCSDFSSVISQAAQDYIGPRYINLTNLTKYYSTLFDDRKGNYQWITNSQIQDEYDFMTIVHGDDTAKPKAVLKFDEFSASMSMYYDEAIKRFGPNLDFSNLEVLEFFQDSSTLIQFLWADYKIKEYNVAHTDAPIKDVIIDISNNGGGAVVALSELLAFISDDGVSKMSWYNTAIDEYINSEIRVDTNFDGTFDDNDGYGDVYNFYIVDSGFSFSCGNALPTFASKNSSVPLIGNKTGGGSCWVCGSLTTPYGDIYNMSSTMNFGTLSGNYFYDIDDGTSADIQLLQDYYYNYEYISNIIDSMA